MYAPLPAAIPDAASICTDAYQSQKHTFCCIFNMDTTLKWFMELPDDVLPMGMCIRMIVSDWYREYILSMMDEYVRRINTPANHIDVLFFEPKYQVFVFQHNLRLKPKCTSKLLC